jgi:hypothetical protein
MPGTYASAPRNPGVTHLTVRGAGTRDAPYMEILVFCVLMLIGVVYGYYTVDGSGIAEHPYHDVYGGAPGAFAPSAASGRDETALIANWTRGTR